MTRHCWLATAVFISTALGALMPAYAAEETPPDVITESGVISLSGSELEQVLGDAEQPDSTLEEQAVDQYLNDVPNQGSYLTPQDLEVGSIKVADGLTATIVAPETYLEVRNLDVWADAGSNEVGAAANLALSNFEPFTAGPGMGSWPSWVDSPSYVVQLRLYDNGNFIGESTFQTQRRKYSNDGSATHDIWQVARRGRATPDEIEINNAPDVAAYVKKLWISSRLTDSAQDYAQQWRQDLTSPDAGFDSCTDNGASVTAGPFTFTPSNCEDYDVWQGAIGHQRFDYDQGAYAGGEQRAIAYVSGFQMDNRKFPYMKWYEFVTLRLGHFVGQPELKCTSDERGIEDGTQVLRCDW